MVDSLMVEEIFKKLNSIQYISNIIPILAVVVVAFIGWFFTYRIHKSDKKDKYLLSLAKEKFEASQSAYNFSIKFISIIHGEDELKHSLLEKAKIWFNENNLYLHPSIREDFESTINKLYMYENTLALFYQYKKAGNKVKADEQNKQLKQDFSDIILLNKRIQQNIDLYFKIK